MAVELRFFLFGKPEDELWNVRMPLPKALQLLAKGMGSWLSKVADHVARLTQDGWKCSLDACDVNCWHKDVRTRADAVRRLNSLRIKIDDVEIAEFEDEDELLEMARKPKQKSARKARRKPSAA
jgi:hypothetical protein